MDEKEGSQEGEYGWCTLDTRMNIEFSNMLKGTKIERRKTEERTIWAIKYIYVEMSHWNSLT
jgi:hypothetical protein